MLLNHNHACGDQDQHYRTPLAVPKSDEEIFAIKENINYLNSIQELVQLEYNYLSSPEKILELNNLYFNGDLKHISRENLIFIDDTSQINFENIYKNE